MYDMFATIRYALKRGFMVSFKYSADGKYIIVNLTKLDDSCEIVNFYNMKEFEGFEYPDSPVTIWIKKIVDMFMANGEETTAGTILQSKGGD